ncbi:MAG: coenzyme F430 synthase [Euryarchaeota archaeon]|nr:coenzyme F430 synthase [Euryarchaeota archaeon]
MSAGPERYVVLDLTHGGLFISQELAELGHAVSAVDVYDTVDEQDLADLRQRGIAASRDAVPLRETDVLVVPVHLDPAYTMLQKAHRMGIPVISHHRATGMVLIESGVIDGATVIEITGSKAKTSTASILADILSRTMSVVLHTSRGLEYWDKGDCRPIHTGLSIAPGSILAAIHEVQDAHVRPSVYIFEVSLGGTGYADIGVITTLSPDYRIACDTGWASDAKMQMIEHAKQGATLIINTEAEKAIHRADQRGVKVIRFSDSPHHAADINIRLDDHTLMIETNNNNFTLTMRDGYDVASYTTAIAAAVGVADHMGIKNDMIRTTLSGFGGLTGRGRQQDLDGRVLIDNSNSGMDIRSAERALEQACVLCTSNNIRVCLVIGEDASQVCEGLPPTSVVDLLERHIQDIDSLVLVGERMQGIKYDNTYYAGSLQEGLSMALERTEPADLIISCVKCFR